MAKEKLAQEIYVRVETDGDDSYLIAYNDPAKCVDISGDDDDDAWIEVGIYKLTDKKKMRLKRIAEVKE